VDQMSTLHFDVGERRISKLGPLRLHQVQQLKNHDNMIVQLPSVATTSAYN